MMKPEKPGAKTFEWFRIRPRDFLLDEAFEEKPAAVIGGWLLIACRMWVAGGSLPDDEALLRKHARMDEAEWERHGSTIRSLFFRRGGQLYSNFVSSQLQFARNSYDARVRGAESTNEKRRESNELRRSARAQRSDSERSPHAISASAEHSSAEHQRSGAKRSGVPRARGRSTVDGAPAASASADSDGEKAASDLTDGLIDPDVRLTAAQRFERMLRERHGDDVNTKSVLDAVLKELGVRADLNAYLKSPRVATANPEKLSNPGGFYRAAAREMREAAGTTTTTNAAGGETTIPGLCPTCKGKGKTADGLWCDCRAAEERRECEGREAARVKDDLERQAAILEATPGEIERAAARAKETVQ